MMPAMVAWSEDSTCRISLSWQGMQKVRMWDGSDGFRTMAP
jgi:hypothetical protein